MGEVSERRFGLRARDGAEPPARAWALPGEQRAVLVVAHGMGEHSGRYRAPLMPLIREGIAVYALDHRGHGLAVREGENFGDYGPGGVAGVVSDVAALVDLARAENPGLPVILFGHSMGSMIAQAYALDHSASIDGLVLCGSAAVDVIAQAGAANPDIFAALNTPFEPARTPFDWLSRDAAQVDLYVADEWCGFALTPESFMELLSQGQRLADPSSIRTDLPVYIFSGDHDPLHLMLKALQPLVDRYWNAGLSLTAKLYQGGRHEILLETNGADVVRDLKHWMNCNCRIG